MQYPAIEIRYSYIIQSKKWLQLQKNNLNIVKKIVHQRLQSTQQSPRSEIWFSHLIALLGLVQLLYNIRFKYTTNKLTVKIEISKRSKNRSSTM